MIETKYVNSSNVELAGILLSGFDRKTDAYDWLAEVAARLRAGKLSFELKESMAQPDPPSSKRS